MLTVAKGQSQGHPTVRILAWPLLAGLSFGSVACRFFHFALDSRPRAKRLSAGFARNDCFIGRAFRNFEPTTAFLTTE
jgi:hypothetical protein